MEKVYKSWSQLKSMLNTRNTVLYYEENDDDFYVWIEIGNKEFHSSIPIVSGNSDYAEFLENYKPLADTYHPITEDGKEIIMTTSRPLDTHTIFVDKGDSATEIGAGTDLVWDFSNDDDEIDMPSGSGMKRKRVEFKFLDSVWMKEGTLYFFNAPKGSYIDFYVVCPQYGYYIDNSGQLKQATEDTPVIHYGVHCHMQGSVPMGDELNTESCSVEIKVPYKFWMEITTPDTDNESNGYVRLELYRKRSVIL
jgi:hypothetical protein